MVDKTPKPGCRAAVRAFVISIVAMAIIVVGIIYGVISWLDRYTHHDESVRVPAVIGLTSEEAEMAIEQAGLTPMIIDSVYSDSQPGAVIEQLPEGNLPVKLGRIVYLTINAHNRQMVVMPDLRDWSSRQAKSRLLETGFIVDSISYEPYEYDDLVLNVTSGMLPVEPGRKYPIRMHVVLHVGSTKIEPPVEEDWSDDLDSDYVNDAVDYIE
jgi:beta-lactam-binding protein with PASTA domain